MRRKPLPDDNTGWQQFVLDNGFRANAVELAAVIGRSFQEVEQVRGTGACKHRPKGKRFAELFTLWHGRAPQDAEWPLPRKSVRGGYAWQPPEVTLLISLVGVLSAVDIAKALTARLREITGDQRATRSPTSVQLCINRIGMQSSDVLGGVTIAEAGKEVNSLPVVQQGIRNKQLRAIRVGRLWVIPHAAWAEWKSKRVFPPEGYVRLSTLKEPLSIRSDKLSEFARMGYVPTAMRCNPYGTKGPSTQFGVWYVDQAVATSLLADRRSGRPMPWHGKPIMDNLRATFKLWGTRKHPLSCKTCAALWGEKGPPQSYDEYIERYPQLAHGAKKHLTRPWNPGLTSSEVAQQVGCSISRVQRAIRNGMLEPVLDGRRQYISRTDATRWFTRKCPTGESEHSWISLQTASKQYLFTVAELRQHIANKTLLSKTGTAGVAKGVAYVSRHQCGQLRAKIGFTEEEAARRAGVTVPRFRLLLEGVNWRKADGIPLATVHAVIKRLESREGYTIEEAAPTLGTTVQWILARIADGTVKVSKAKWDRRRVYLTDPMMQRLADALQQPAKRKRLSDDWLRLSDAAQEAGVTTATLIKWAEQGELTRRQGKDGWRYHRDAVRARARHYWSTVRFHRAVPPAWLSGARNIRPTIQHTYGDSHAAG